VLLMHGGLDRSHGPQMMRPSLLLMLLLPRRGADNWTKDDTTAIWMMLAAE